jgi:glycolate oxidase iron-sulfur subunit
MGANILNGGAENSGTNSSGMQGETVEGRGVPNPTGARPEQSDLIDLRSGKLQISKELLDGCIHCGLCLPACPTYLATGREMESPRGRIFLINQWQSEWKISGAKLSDRAAEHIDSCLGCLGCQTACPSGVQYEELLNTTRALNIDRQSPLARGFMRFAFSQLLPHYGRLHVMGALLRFVQWLQLDLLFVKIASAISSPERFKLLHKLASWQMFVPRVEAHIKLPQKSWRSGAKAGQVELFAGCVMDVFYNHVNHAAIRLLKKRSLVVNVPSQTCCGALAFHAGFVDIASDLARQNIDLFQDTQDKQSAIAVTSAGCGAMLKHYGHLLAEDKAYSEKATAFSARVKDLSEVLYANKLDTALEAPVSGDAPAEKIVYHAACHLAHAQSVRVEPAALLTEAAAHSGAHLYDLPEAEHCCGSAGIYNLINTEMSLAVLERKMKFIEESGADVVVTSNPGCMLQIEAGIKARGLNVKVKHLAEALDDPKLAI